MNGYEGSFEKYIKTLSPAKLLEAEMKRNIQKARDESKRNQSFGIMGQTKVVPHAGNGFLNKQQPLPPHQVTKPVQGRLDNKDLSRTHPAAKPEVNLTSNRQYQPLQFQKPLMYTPATQEIRYPQNNSQAQQLAARTNPAHSALRDQSSHSPVQQNGVIPQQLRQQQIRSDVREPAHGSGQSPNGRLGSPEQMFSVPSSQPAVGSKALYPHQLPLKPQGMQEELAAPSSFHEQAPRRNGTQPEQPDGLADVTADTATTVQHIMFNVRSRVEAYEQGRTNK